ncbi:MAG: ATP-binding cassette domain-containing protein [Elusimicrobia bacterium]|nr:ATP-binding cassette domain-containing protein [Elusimicrobiota bacterium]
MPEPIVLISNLSYAYPSSSGPGRLALKSIDLSVEKGEIFGFLGPNGSGKTTLFRILSTYFLPEAGQIRVLGLEMRRHIQEIRRNIGVVFQYPSLDLKLTASENLRHQGHLYGLYGGLLTQRMARLLDLLELSERSGERIENFSGGMRRRLEIAKCLLHRPQMLLLDEPSTGLDPGARRNLWSLLKNLNQNEGVTILLTTHLMEEADQLDRIALLNHGQLVKVDAPAALKKTIGGDVVRISASEAASSSLLTDIRAKFGGEPVLLDGLIHLEIKNGHQFIPQLVEAFPGRIEAVSLGKPTLEDVFIHYTGQAFWEKTGQA